MTEAAADNSSRISSFITNPLGLWPAVRAGRGKAGAIAAGQGKPGVSAQVVVVVAAEEIGKQESILGLKDASVCKDVDSDEVQSVSERTVLVLELPSRDFLRLLLLLINSSGISGILLSILLLTQDWMFLLSVTVLRYASPTEVCLVFTGLQIVLVLCVELPMLGVMFCW